MNKPRLKKTLGKFLAVTAIVFQQSVTTHAATVFSNLGSGDSFGSAGTSFGFNDSQLAYSFNVDASATPFFLDSIDVALSGGNSGTGVSVNLATNLAGGLEPDTILESSSVFVFGTSALKTAPFTGTTLVSTPGTYWVWLDCTSGCFSNATWYDNNIGALSDQATQTTPSSPWNVFSTMTQGAFRVNGTVVPLPPALWLFGSGLLGLVGLARRKKAA